MTFKDYLKKKLKYLLGLASLAAIVSQLILPITGANAAEPRFNFLPGDYELLRGANISRNESVWKDPVSGTAGDEFRGVVYYHNGVVDSTARNVRIKVNLPTQTTNKTAHLTASISADNASTVTDTVVDGQIVGPSGLTVNFDQDVDLEYVPGSTKWFPNAAPVGAASTPLPNGQNGSEIISGNGVNIGDINSCWEFAGFVTFGFKAKAIIIEKPALNIEKTVLNQSRNEVAFHDKTVAAPGETMVFQIEATNGGNAPLSNLNIKDVLPSGFSFVPGSLEKAVDGGSLVSLSDTVANQFFDGGYDFGTLNTVECGGKLVIRFKAKVKADFCGFLINKAIATSGSLKSEDTATVDVQCEEKIVKSKSAYNDTKRENATEARAGEEITYTLNTKNAGNIAINFVVEDDISDILEYANVVSVSDNGVVTDGFVRYPTVKIDPGQTISRTFKVKVKNPLPNNPKSGYHFDDIMFNVYGNEIIIKIIREKIVEKLPCLHIAKYVRNETRGETNFVKENGAQGGDVLEYRINFTNTGEGAADQVRISDSLPANVAFVAGTTRISRNGGVEQTLPDGIISEGITLDSIAPGESSYVKIKAKIDSGVAANQVLVNTAFLTDNGKTISDTAKTTIGAKAPEAAAPTQLPKTGAASAASFLITLFAGIGILFIRYRKLYDPEKDMVIGQLLAN